MYCSYLHRHPSYGHVTSPSPELLVIIITATLLVMVMVVVVVESAMRIILSDLNVALKMTTNDGYCDDCDHDDEEEDDDGDYNDEDCNNRQVDRDQRTN